MPLCDITFAPRKWLGKSRILDPVLSRIRKISPRLSLGLWDLMPFSQKEIIFFLIIFYYYISYILLIILYYIMSYHIISYHIYLNYIALPKTLYCVILCFPLLHVCKSSIFVICSVVSFLSCEHRMQPFIF